MSKESEALLHFISVDEIKAKCDTCAQDVNKTRFGEISGIF